jgi:formate hydrogenlyase transcriptional activator
MIQADDGQYQADIQYRAFEELLLEISAQFINLPTEEIDEVIEETQGRICKHLGLDLSALWQWSANDTRLITITHLYTIEGGPGRPVDIDGSKVFPWVYQKMLEGETLAFSNSQLPREADIDKESRKSFGVESSVVLPLKTGNGPLLGILTFDILHRERSWSEQEIKRLKLVAQVFYNALTRKRSEQELIQSEARLGLAAESAEAGMWELDYKSKIFWATDQARKIFDYGLDEIIDMKRFEQSVDANDRLPVKQALAESFEQNNRFTAEYRITTDKGEKKWVCSSGRPYFHSDGSPARMLGISSDISERKRLEETLKQNLAEINLLKKQIEQENHYLREDLKAEQGSEHIIGQSKEFKAVLTSVRQVASTTATVLLLGETGTGKGVVAHTVHMMSDRSSKPFVTVNCAALPHNLIESELFGREKGAFTGAHAMQAGRFEVANRGTIFLDEIGEMSLEMQAKLLGVLQDGTFERLGSPKSVKVDVRVIVATARNLRDDVKNGRFREDLYYRLKVFPITIPPLRQRKDDIPLLTQHFIEKYSRKMGKEIDRISKRSLDKLLNYPWPGNVRELEHLVERSVIISPGNSLVIGEQLIPGQAADLPDQSIKDLASHERDHIRDVLGMTNWKIEGPGGAASILNIHPSTLRFRLKKLNITRPS